MIDQTQGRGNLQYQINQLSLSIRAGENSNPFTSPIVGGTGEGANNYGGFISPSLDLAGDRERLAELVNLRDHWDALVRPAWQEFADEAHEKKTNLLALTRELAEQMRKAHEKDAGLRTVVKEWCKAQLEIKEIDMSMKTVSRELGSDWTRYRPTWPFGGRMGAEDIMLLKEPTVMANTIAGHMQAGGFPSASHSGQIRSFGGAA